MAIQNKQEAYDIYLALANRLESVRQLEESTRDLQDQIIQVLNKLTTTFEYADANNDVIITRDSLTGDATNLNTAINNGKTAINNIVTAFSTLDFATLWPVGITDSTGMADV